MNTIKWIRPSGTEIETNDTEDVIDYCISLGWKPAESEKKPARKKAKKKTAKKRA